MSGHRVTFPRVLRAEWTKLCALRSTWIMLALVVVLPAGLGAGAGAQSHRASVGAAFTGVDVVSLLLGVFGVLTVTGEYGSGLIRATFAAVPRRAPVLAAKAVALAALALPFALAASTASVALNRMLAGATPGVEPGTVRATIGAAVAPVALALLGLGIGALVRHTAAAITVYVLSMLVLPAVVEAVLPPDVGGKAIRFVPVAAAQGLYAVGNPFRMFPPGPAAAVLAGWVTVVLCAGALVLWRRDP